MRFLPVRADLCIRNKRDCKLCEKGLRYDLTVPFARYVVQHRDELQLPFKRYQIQPVWRADRPQRGRYREFYQCDADIVGSDSLLNEVELLLIADEVFRRFGIRVAIKLNNRKILSGIAEVIGAADRIVDITVAIDKLDKIGLEGVNAELAAAGLSDAQVENLQPIICLSGTNAEKLADIRKVLAGSETGMLGCQEVETVLNALEGQTANTIELDLTLARGLNYYTGCIVEVKALDAEMGSISGGGRYDKMMQRFGLECPATGFAVGVDRVLLALERNGVATNNRTWDVLVTWSEGKLPEAIAKATALRREGRSVKLLTEAADLQGAALAVKEYGCKSLVYVE